MSHTIEKLPERPIVVVSYHADYDLAAEGADTVNGLRAVLEAQSEPIYLVYNTLEMAISLDDLIAGTDMIVRGDAPVIKDPHVREAILITTSDLFKLAARGVSNPIFGNISVKVFSTLEEGLAYCH